MRLPILLIAAAALACAQNTVAPSEIPDTPPVYRDLRFPELKPIPVPAVTTYTLPNGMRIFLVEDHELPVIRGIARARTGNLFDPPDKVGLAGVTGAVMRSGGTAKKTGDELDEELENIAASVEADIGETSGSVSFNTLKDNTDEVLAIFRDVLTAPAFRQERIDLALAEERSSIARRNDDAHGIAQREFTDIVYGKDTPYGWQLEYATLANIHRDDLVAFYNRYFFPGNVLMSVWGDFSIPDMEAKLTRLFADWTRQQSKVPPFPAVREKPVPGVFVANKEDVTQTFLVAGHLGGELKDPELPALEVMADILGGGFESRLVRRVRTQLGLAYSISSDWGSNYDHPGLFSISGSTKAGSTADTLKAVQGEIERIRTGEVSADELETARQTVLNSLVFAFDTKAKTLGRLLNYEYYGYPHDFVEQYQRGVEKVTAADVLRAARDRIHAKDMTIVAVGNAAEFQKSLATLGMPVSSIDLTIPEPKEAAPAKTDAGGAVGAAGSGGAEKGRQLLARVQQAVGGADKLAAVKDLTEVAQFHIDPAAGGGRLQRTDRWIAPSYFREDTVLPVGTVSLYGDGAGGWMASPQGTAPLAAAQLKPVRDKLLRLYFPLLLSDREAGRTLSAAGENEIEISGGHGDTVRLFIDGKTGMPVKVAYGSMQMGGKTSTIEEVYTSFQTVDGIQVPSAFSISQDGHKYADVTVESLKLNTGLKAEDLGRKP